MYLRKFVWSFAFLVSICCSIFGLSKTKELFSNKLPSFSESLVKTDPYSLLAASKYALCSVLGGSVPEGAVLSVDDIKSTLSFIIQAIEQDIEQGVDSFRIQDQQFLKKHFLFIKWHGDHEQARCYNVSIPQKPIPGNIRLTKYAVFQTTGSDVKKGEHSCALYGITSKTFKEELRKKFTKQEILSGVLEQEAYRKHVTPLVWVPRQGLEDGLMQGSVVVIQDGKRRVFNVDKSNEIPYDRKIKNGFLQKRYWYFKEITDLDGFPPHAKERIIEHSGVALAGDLENLGFGNIFLLRYINKETKRTECKLGVLIDKGGAFAHNLYQLDFFAGIFPTRLEYEQYAHKIPKYVGAYLLKKKN